MQATAYSSADDAEGQQIQHAMIDRLRACSTDTDAAVEFFTCAFDPEPATRLTAAEALEHPYLLEYVRCMRYDRSKAAHDGDSSAVRHKQRLGPIRLVRKQGFRLIKGVATGAVIKGVATDAVWTIKHPVAALQRLKRIPNLELYFAECKGLGADSLTAAKRSLPTQTPALNSIADEENLHDSVLSFRWPGTLHHRLSALDDSSWAMEAVNMPEPFRTDSAGSLATSTASSDSSISSACSTRTDTADGFDTASSGHAALTGSDAVASSGIAEPTAACCASLTAANPTAAVTAAVSSMSAADSSPRTSVTSSVPQLDPQSPNPFASDR